MNVIALKILYFSPLFSSNRDMDMDIDVYAWAVFLCMKQMEQTKLEGSLRQM